MRDNEKLSRALNEVLGEPAELPKPKIPLNPTTGQPDYRQYFAEQDDPTGATRLMRLLRDSKN